MLRFALLFCAVIVAVVCSVVSAGAADEGKIKHVIVLVMENRAFDHMVGFMKAENPEINGCLPGLEGCSNPDDPANPTTWTSVSDDAVYRTLPDPSHSISGTTQQIYPLGENSTSASMMGFIHNYKTRGTSEPQTIMQSFSPEHVPIITQLAREYALVDGWFAGVPGPTEPNRCYVVSATSHGMGTNDAPTMVKGLPQKTMFSQVLDMGLDYRLYMKQVPANLMFKEMRRRDARHRYKFFGKFLDDLSNGTMPDFSFIEPGYFDTPYEGASDQHPDHDVSLGEALIKEIYEAVRASPVWESTALVITWDEHGGFFDHVTPPTNVPSPDGIVSTDDPFDYTRLGVRVPTVIISPYVPKGTVLHAAPQGEPQFEHSSLPATIVHKILKPKSKLFKTPDYLTARDAWARTFEGVFSEESPRQDCPTQLADVPSHRALFPNSLPPLDGKMKITELQQTMVMLTAAVSKDELAQSVVAGGVKSIVDWTEHEAMLFIEPRMKKFMDDDSQDPEDF